MSALETVYHNTVYTFVATVTAARTFGPAAALEVTDTADVTRLLVVTSDCPGIETEWTTGELYRFESVVGCNPNRPLFDSTSRRRERLRSSVTVPTNAMDIDLDTCPNCGGQLQLANTLTLSKRAREIIETLPREFMLVATDSSKIQRLGETINDDISTEPVSESTPPPRVVCTECECRVREYYGRSR
jgi:ribosomal protein L32